MSGTLRKYISLLVLLVVVVGCSYWDRPERPRNSGGWKEERFGKDYISIGGFVLDKGQSTENGEIGIKVIDFKSPSTTPPKSIESDGSQVTLRFYRPSDQKVICDATFEVSSSGSYDLYRACSKELPFNNIRVNAIDAEAGWVGFSVGNLLDGTEKERHKSPEPPSNNSFNRSGSNISFMMLPAM